MTIYEQQDLISTLNNEFTQMRDAFECGGFSLEDIAKKQLMLLDALGKLAYHLYELDQIAARRINGRG